MKINNLLIALLFFAVTISCKKKDDEKPVYKFYVKLNGTEYFTNQVYPDPQVKYISDCYYSSSTGGTGTFYFKIYEPVSGQSIEFSIYIDDISKPNKIYNLTSSSSSEAYFRVKNNDYPSDYAYGTFEITNLKLNSNSSSIQLSTVSARFNLTQKATHSDGITRTTTLSDGELNDVEYIY